MKLTVGGYLFASCQDFFFFFNNIERCEIQLRTEENHSLEDINSKKLNFKCLLKWMKKQ